MSQPTKKKNKPVKKPDASGLVSTSHRFDPKRLEKASELGIDVPAVLRRALDKAIASVSHECPTCGSKVVKS